MDNDNLLFDRILGRRAMLAPEVIPPALFPLFENRLMNPTREDYGLHLELLGLQQGEDDPLVILARSGGRRETDSYHVFPAPFERHDAEGRREVCIQFFTNGFQYTSGDVGNAAERPIFLMWDFQNPEDDRALMIRSENNQNLGWVPRYYNRMLLKLRERGVPITARAEHVNPPGTPPWYRVLCSVTAPWPQGFDPVAEDEECGVLA